MPSRMLYPKLENHATAVVPRFEWGCAAITAADCGCTVADVGEIEGETGGSGGTPSVCGTRFPLSEVTQTRESFKETGD
jgi:hypothetical protein